MKKLLLFCFVLFPLLVCAQVFTEVSEEAGINHAFKIDLATFGGGACVLDFDNDGFEDLYVTGGANPDVLYKNNGDGTFTDVFETAGFTRTKEMYTQGATAADINRDGHKDIIVTTMNFLNENREIAPNLLYLNNGDGTFTDVTNAWGLGAFKVNSMGATFGDINADGYPDLFVGNYFTNSTAGFSIYNEQTITNSFRPSLDFLFVNVGGEYFVDVREFYGLDHESFGFQGMFTDYDNDRDLDLYIVNDFGFRSTPNLMFRNDFPEKKLTERSINLALNFGMNAMGVASTDINNDGWMDYFVTNLGTSLFNLNRGNGEGFVDRTVSLNLAVPVIEREVYTGPPVSWGANFFDFDHDTDEDLFICNGALNPTIRVNPNLFFELDNGKFEEVGEAYGLADLRIGRGSVVFDYDNDGDLDLFVVNQIPRDITSTIPEARCLLFRNDVADGNWLQVELEGVQADKNGLGSRVEALVDGKLLIQEIHGGGSHISQNTTIAHFGLADATEVEELTIKWVGGNTQTLRNVTANQKIKITEEMNAMPFEQANRLNVFPSNIGQPVLIEYDLNKSGPIEIGLYDTKGALIEKVVDISSEVSTGFWQWTPKRDLPSGIYYFRLLSDSGSITRRVIKI